jgi:hypothetical protein
MIKTFEQFKNDTPVEEGLFGAFRARKQILEVQSQVVEAYEKLIEKDPKRFNSGKSVLKAVESFAYDLYKKTVTEETALTFTQWWEEFEKAHTYMLDKTIFNTK